MAKKLLAGAEYVDNWTSVAGALTGALRFLGDPVSAAWVMGITGHAFRLALPIGAEGVALPGAETALDLKRAAGLYRNLGRKVEFIHAAAGARDERKQRDEAIKRVRKSIDHGHPAIVYDLHLPKFGLVTGYDDTANTWQVRTVLTTAYAGTLPLSRWPVPEQHEPVIAILLDGHQKVDPRRAVRAALSYAVDYAERGDPGDTSGALHGFAAYERWQQAFARGEPVSPTGNAVLVQMLQSARRDAAAFLRADATRVLPHAAGALSRAAAAYDAEVLAVSRMMTMFPFPTGGDTTNPASRVVATGALREALAQERRAVDALREIIDAA
jgi:hypothetical protein